jgi:transcription elongation factor GreA
VTVRWDDGAEETYTIVEPVASDPRGGWISTESPVGRGLLGRRPGERVTVATPGGHSRLVVLTVA